LTRPDFVTEQRIRTVEARTSRLEEDFQTSMYVMGRRVAGLQITLARVAASLNVTPANEAEIDEALEG
jgi:hypothetical protein